MMRFLVEISTWIWLLFYNWFLLPLSLLSLGLLNYPGDKKPEMEEGIGIMVPGVVRILVEIISAALGIFAAYQLLSFFGLIIQLFITLISFALDFERWLWMLNRNEIPDYVTYVYKTQRK